MAAHAIRYDRLGYVALNVSDLARSSVFYENMLGLEPVACHLSDRAYFRCSDSHHDIALFEGSPGLKRVGWALEGPEVLEAARDHVASLGLAPQAVSVAECNDLRIGAAFRFVEPNSGATFEFFVGMAPAPTPFKISHTKIARLGHVVLNVPDRKAMQAYMVDQLNFRVSDEIDGSVTFMRCFPNPYHHSLGLSQARAGAGLNHVNFMVTEMDDIGKGLWRCKTFDAPVVFGPGRHPPSDSIFLYFLDPDGLTLEYSFGMEEFPERDPRPARLMPPGLASIDYWGAVPDMRFAKTGVIEPLKTAAAA